MNELSRRLRALRIGSGMSQSEVGTQVGLSRSAVTQIESGNRDVTADELVRFSTTFGRSPVSLLSGLEQGTGESVGEMDGMLDNIRRTLPGQGSDLSELRTNLDRLIELPGSSRRPNPHSASRCTALRRSRFGGRVREPTGRPLIKATRLPRKSDNAWTWDRHPSVTSRKRWRP